LGVEEGYLDMAIGFGHVNIPFWYNLLIPHISFSKPVGVPL